MCSKHVPRGLDQPFSHLEVVLLAPTLFSPSPVGIASVLEHSTDVIGSETGESLEGCVQFLVLGPDLREGTCFAIAFSPQTMQGGAGLLSLRPA
ncbi:hypothetical protein [Streptomyces chartreusis]|uniref:hypothetical protein n=1 Tax=Streptomyces chartreusis TaxID=1969 RepID=UPI002E1977F6